MRNRGGVYAFERRRRQKGAEVLGWWGRDRLVEWLRGRHRRGFRLRRQLLRKTSVCIAHAQSRAVSQRSNPDTLPVDVSPIRAGQIVQDEKPALEDDLAV